MLKQDNIAPDIVDVTVSFAIPDFAEPAFSMQRPAGRVANKNLRLQRPVSRLFGNGDQAAQ